MNKVYTRVEMLARFKRTILLHTNVHYIQRFYYIL